MATINSISGTGSSGYTAAIAPAERVTSVAAGTPGVDAPLPFPTDPIDLNGDGAVSQGEIAQSLRPRELVQEEAPEPPALSTAAFAELAAPAEEPPVQEADAQDPAVQQQAAAQQPATSEAAAEPPPPPAAPRAAADTTTTATSTATATTGGSAIADAESAVTSLLGELASRSYGAVQSPRVAQPALSLVA